MLGEERSDLRLRRVLHKKSGNWKKQPKCNSVKTYNSSSIQESRFLNSCVMGWVRVTLESRCAAWALEWDSKIQCLKVQQMDPVIQIYLHSYAPKFLCITQTSKFIKAAGVVGMNLMREQSYLSHQTHSTSIECLHKDSEEMGFCISYICKCGT